MFYEAHLDTLISGAFKAHLISPDTWIYKVHPHSPHRESLRCVSVCVCVYVCVSN